MTNTEHANDCRKERNSNLKKALILAIIALPFIVLSVFFYLDGKADGDIWGAVFFGAFGMVWAIPAIGRAENAHTWHKWMKSWKKS